MNRPLFALVLLLPSACVLAAPAITAVTANGSAIGTATDDMTVQIDGSGFGTNNLRIGWLGGSSGVIERASSGPFLNTPRPGWAEDRDLNESWIDTRRVYSGGKSLVFDPTISRHGDGRFGLAYDTGTNYTELYSSYMVYLDVGNTPQGQWKMIRWVYQQSVTDDARPNMYMANWEGGPGDFVQLHGGGDATRTIYFTGGELPLSGGWYRVETYLRPSSTPSAADAQFWVRSTRVSDGNVFTQTFNGVKTYANGESNRFRWIIFQNYMGNGYENTRAWMDDIYVSQTQARVELCTSATWAGCVRREIQPPATWSANRITVTLNKGGLANLTGTYLYVVDSTGAANAQGYLLTGGGGPTPPPVTPMSPTTLSVQ